MTDNAAGSAPLNHLGVLNARDLGGTLTESGRAVVPGRLYRAELVREARDGSTEAFRRLGITTVIDLRGEAEAAAAPSAWARLVAADAALTFPIDDGTEGHARDYVGMLLSGELKQFTAHDLAEHYVTVLEARAGTFAEAVEAVATGGPTLVHCTEGKDRTGLLIALILDVLGVPVSVIVADYAQSDEARPDRALGYAARFDAAGIALSDYRSLYEAPPSVMSTALDHLHTRYGGAERYLIDRGGLSVDTIHRLRTELLGV